MTDFNNLRSRLLDAARKAGCCRDGRDAIRAASSPDDLARLYLSIPDWCLERDFPSPPDIRRWFPDSRKYGIFVGETFNGELLSDKQVYVFHDCRGWFRVGLNVSLALIPMLYIAGRSRLRIVGQGGGVVPVYVFGDNHVTLSHDKQTRLIRYNESML